MNTQVRNWIFVTGAPRSGTTFVGKVLSAPLEVDYIHEPFNPDCGIPGIEQRFLYLRPEGSEFSKKYDEIIKDMFKYKLSLRTGFYRNDTKLRKFVKRYIGSRGPIYLRLAKLNPFHKTAVIKDPIGCLMTEYLAIKYNVKPVILIRHPIAFVASTIRLKWDWELDLAPIRQQKELVDDYFSEEYEFLCREWKSTVEAAAALWRVLNKVLLSQIKRNPHWHVFTHEELSRSPVNIFNKLYEDLELPWSRRIEKMIVRRTQCNNKSEATPRRVQDFNRDSAEIFYVCLKMLSPEQRRKIYETTKDISSIIYPEDSFGLI